MQQPVCGAEQQPPDRVRPRALDQSVVFGMHKQQCWRKKWLDPILDLILIPISMAYALKDEARYYFENCC